MPILEETDNNNVDIDLELVSTLNALYLPLIFTLI